MALTDRLMNDLRTRLPGATDGAIQREVWATLNDFCREGHAWREQIGITPVAGQVLYSIAPVGTEVVFVHSLSHVTLDVSGAVYEAGKILLVTAPTSAHVGADIYVDTILAPALDAGADLESLIPSDMWSEHHDAIFNGTLGRMLAQPAKPYSNPSLAAFYVRSYTGARAAARRKVRTGGMMDARTWRYPRWSSGRGA